MHNIAFAVWVVNVIFVLVSYINPIPQIWIFPFFLWCLIGFAEAEHKNHPENDAPKWVRNILAVCKVYFGVNFLVSMVLLWEGGPHMDNGIYCVMTHGDFVREISYTEYMRLMRVESGFVFSGILPFTSAVMGKHFGIYTQRQYKAPL